MWSLIAKILIPLMPVIAKILSMLLDKWKDSVVKKKNKEISRLPYTRVGQKQKKKCVVDKEQAGEAHRKFNDFLRQFRDTHKQLKNKPKL